MHRRWVFSYKLENFHPKHIYFGKKYADFSHAHSARVRQPMEIENKFSRLKNFLATPLKYTWYVTRGRKNPKYVPGLNHAAEYQVWAKQNFLHSNFLLLFTNLRSIEEGKIISDLCLSVPKFY